MSTNYILLIIKYLNHIVSLIHNEIGRKIDKCAPLLRVKSS